MNGKMLFFINIVLLGTAVRINGVINPMALYTPITAVTQTAQNATTSYQSSIKPPSLAPISSTPTISSSLAIPLSSTSIGITGIVLKTSGYYQLSESINCTALHSPIVIAASHVILDLNGQTLQYTGSRSGSFHAIVVAAGTTNVSIQNGTISGFCGGGIASSGSIDNPVLSLTLQNLKIIGCYHGVLIEATNSLLISNCTALENSNPVHTTCGIEVSNSSGIIIQQCTSQNNKSPIGNCYGYVLTNCKNTVLVNCSANGNEGLLETAGFYFEEMLRNNYIKNCVANGNSSNTSNAYGIAIDNSYETYIQDSITQNNRSNSVTSHSYGIQLTNSSNSLITHNSIDKNDYGIYDDEPAGKHTNIFTQNLAYQNKISDYLRPYSSPLSHIQIQPEYLQKMLTAGSFDNISIRISF